MKLKSIFLAFLGAQSAFSQSESGVQIFPELRELEQPRVPFQNVSLDECPVSFPSIMTSQAEDVKAAEEATENEDTEIFSLHNGLKLGMLVAILPYVRIISKPLLVPRFREMQSEHTRSVELIILGAFFMHIYNVVQGNEESFLKLLPFAIGLQVGLLAPYEKELFERLASKIMRSASVVLEGIQERKLIRESANALADLLPNELARLTLEHVFNCDVGDPDRLKRTSPAQAKEEVDEVFHHRALTSQYNLARVSAPVQEEFSKSRKIRSGLAH